MEETDISPSSFYNFNDDIKSDDAIDTNYKTILSHQYQENILVTWNILFLE